MSGAGLENLFLSPHIHGSTAGVGCRPLRHFMAIFLNFLAIFCCFGVFCHFLAILGIFWQICAKFGIVWQAFGLFMQYFVDHWAFLGNFSSTAGVGMGRPSDKFKSPAYQASDPKTIVAWRRPPRDAT